MSETDSSGWIETYTCVNCNYHGHKTIEEPGDNEYFQKIDPWTKCPKCGNYIHVCKGCGMVKESRINPCKCSLKTEKQVSLDIF